MHIARSRGHFALVVILALCLGALAIACRGGANRDSAGHGINPPPATPATLTPDSYVMTASQALHRAAAILGGAAGAEFTSTNITSVGYVQTTAGQADALVHLGSADNPSSTVWLFVAYGDFHRVLLKDKGRGPLMHTLSVIVV